MPIRILRLLPTHGTIRLERRCTSPPSGAVTPQGLGRPTKRRYRITPENFRDNGADIWKLVAILKGW